MVIPGNMDDLAKEFLETACGGNEGRGITFGFHVRQAEAGGPGTFAVGCLEVLAVPIHHTAQSLAYRITDGAGRSVALSGDADVCAGLAEVARDTDLFICDSAFPGACRTEGHLTPGLAGEWAQKAGTRKLCLTHFYPECDGHDLLSEARETFAGEIVLAEDLMRFDLS